MLGGALDVVGREGKEERKGKERRGKEKRKKEGTSRAINRQF